MDEDELIALLKKNLTIETGHRSNDPEDDGRVVCIYYGETKLSEADL